MATTIANLNVKLSANIAGFASGMANAVKPLASFAGKVASVGTKLTAFAGAATALVAGGSLVMLTKHSMEAIDTNAKLADRIGMTTEGLAGLQHAGNLAGVSSEALTGALEKMLKSLGGAADDGELASNAFTKLGLSAAQLANVPADEAFATIAQKISEIQNPAERATAAMAIFGKSGQALLPLMMSGAEGIKAAQQEAEKLGLTYSRVDAAKVEQANDAITRMSAIFTGVSNQLAIGLAPYIEAAAAKLTDMATAGDGIGPRVGGAIEWIAKAIATAADYLQLLPMGFYGFRAGALQAIASVLGAVDTLGSGLVKLMNLLPGVNVSWTDTFSTLQQGMEQVAAEEAAKFDKALGTFQRGDNAVAVAKVFDDIKAKSTAAAQTTADNAKKMQGAFEGLEDSTDALKKVSDALADLDKAVRQASMTDSAKKLDDLSVLGATPEQLAQAQASLNKLDELETARKRQEDAQQRAKSVIESIATPMEKFTAREQELSDLLNGGLLTWNQYGRAIADARKELEQAGSTDVATAPDLIKAGSAQAQRLAFDMSRGNQKLNRDDYPKRQYAEAQEQTKLLEQVARNTRTGTDSSTTVVDF